MKKIRKAPKKGRREETSRIEFKVSNIEALLCPEIAKAIVKLIRTPEPSRKEMDLAQGH
jgi:hypothetical protein